MGGSRCGYPTLSGLLKYRPLCEHRGYGGTRGQAGTTGRAGPPGISPVTERTASLDAPYRQSPHDALVVRVAGELQRLPGGAGPNVLALGGMLGAAAFLDAIM